MSGLFIETVFKSPLLFIAVSPQPRNFLIIWFPPTVADREAVYQRASLDLSWRGNRKDKVNPGKVILTPLSSSDECQLNVSIEQCGKAA